MDGPPDSSDRDDVEDARDLLDIVGQLAGRLALLPPVALDGLDDAAFDEVVAGAAAVRREVDGFWLRLCAAAERRQVHRRHGHRDSASWLAQVSGERPGVARRDLELAVVLADAPSVAEAAAEHGLSKTKMAELARAASLPVDVVGLLARDGAGQSVEQLAAAVQRARLEHLVPDAPVEPSCQLVRSSDRVRLTATVGLVEGEVLEVALDAFAEAAKLPKDQPYAQRRAAALIGLARHYLDHASEVPATRVGRPHVLVVVDLEVLEARAGGSATLASGAVITGDEVRALATDAKVTRVVMRGRSQVLDVGRTTRTVPTHLAKAVIARDRHCTHPGCSAPPWACEIHHRTPWARGGRTSVDNLTLRCWFHHGEEHRRAVSSEAA